MVRPVSPVIKGQEAREIQLAPDSEDMRGLRILRLADEYGTAVQRWEFDWRERFRLLFGGSLWIAVRTGWNEVQPLVLLTTAPAVRGDQLVQADPQRPERAP